MSSYSNLDNSKRLVRSRSGLKIVSLGDERTSPFELKEPFWVPDDESPFCSKCQVKFDFLTRRHHCRRCGHIFCSHCCEHKVSLPRMCFVDPVRVCAECSVITKKENEFYEKHLKVLVNGANFLLDEGTGSNTKISILCHLSKDHQEIIFDGGTLWQHDPISLLSVVSVRLLGTSSSQGTSEIIGAVLRFVDFKKDEQELHLHVPDVPNRKQSSSWIHALKKGLRYVTP